MSEKVHELKKGYLLPSLVCLLTDSAGTAVDLTGYTVKMYAKHVSEDIHLEKTATVDTVTAGKVTVPFAEGDTDVEGVYNFFFLVTDSQGKSEPTKSFQIFRIVSDLL